MAAIMDEQVEIHHLVHATPLDIQLLGVEIERDNPCRLLRGKDARHHEGKQDKARETQTPAHEL